jgi:ABC-type polysaccharide/polyol phosphate transport system ATPase subunit
MLMDANTVLEVDGVYKLFSRSVIDSQKRLGDVLRAAMFGRDFTISEMRDTEFWALEDINFTLKRGEALGVLGLNGAGKTTLLRMLNGQLSPDRGEIRIAGATASMIDLSAGLNDRMSGWENIYLRCASIGKSRREVDEIIDEMVDFMELGDALDAPLGSYSSGMRMRLAFATTIFVEPDLLLIDEVLSVGDFRFRQKCLERVRRLREKSAFVLASHSMADIARFCNEAIVLKRGRVAYRGDPESAIRLFQQTQEITERPEESKRARNAPAKKLGEEFHNVDEISSVSTKWFGADGVETRRFRWGEPITLSIEFKLNYAVSQIEIGVPIWRAEEERMISALSTEQLRYKMTPDSEGRCSVRVEFDSQHLLPGAYESVTAIIDGPKYLYRLPNPQILIESGAAPRGWGHFYLPHRWTMPQDGRSR